jgi:hypothetical protein
MRGGGLDVEPHPAAEEIVGIEIPEDEVGVGDGRLGAAQPIADGARRGAGRVRADTDHAAFGPRDGAAAGADLDQVDGLDVHGDPAAGLEPDPVQLELVDGLGRTARDQGQLRGRAAHVEGHEVVLACELTVHRGHERAGRRS